MPKAGQARRNFYTRGGPPSRLRARSDDEIAPIAASDGHRHQEAFPEISAAPVVDESTQSPPPRLARAGRRRVVWRRPLKLADAGPRPGAALVQLALEELVTSGPQTGRHVGQDDVDEVAPRRQVERRLERAVADGRLAEEVCRH